MKKLILIITLVLLFSFSVMAAKPDIKFFNASSPYLWSVNDEVTLDFIGTENNGKVKTVIKETGSGKKHIFNGIAKDISINYTETDWNIKEDIIIEKKPSNDDFLLFNISTGIYSWSFNQTTNFLTIYNVDGSINSQFMPPFYFDSNNSQIFLDADYDGEVYSINITSLQSLHPSNFPLVIDPTYDIYDSSINTSLWGKYACPPSDGWSCAWSEGATYINIEGVRNDPAGWSVGELYTNRSWDEEYILNYSITYSFDGCGTNYNSEPRVRLYIGEGAGTAFYTDSNSDDTCQTGKLNVTVDVRDKSNIIYTYNGTDFNGNAVSSTGTTDGSLFSSYRLRWQAGGTVGSGSQNVRKTSITVYNLTYESFFPPNTTAVSIYSGSNSTGEPIELNCTGEDNEDEDFTFYYRTYMNDTINATGTSGPHSTAGTYNVFDIPISYLSNGQTWEFDCKAVGDDGNSSIVSSLNITLTNSAPTFDEALTDQRIFHYQNLSYDINCTDIESTVSYYDNTTLFDINTTSGEIFDNPDIIERGNHTIGISCGDGIFNFTNTFVYEIKNTAPTISGVTFNPAQTDGSQDVYMTFTQSDSENDMMTNYSFWYKNTIYNSTWNNQMLIGQDNLSDGDVLTISLWIGDGGLNSTLINYTLTINDSVPPTVNRLYVSSQSVDTTDTVTFYANATDVASPLVATSCKFTIRKSDYNGGNGVGNSWNETTNTKSGDILSFALSMSALGAGILEWQNSYCTDAASNTNTNSSVNIDITISEPTPPGGGDSGGGGGGTSFSVLSITEGTSTDVRVAPLILDLRVVRGNQYIREFQVFNLGDDTTFIDVFRDDAGSSTETTDWLYFLVGDEKVFSLDNYIIAAPLTLETQTQYIQFYLEIPDDIELGDYVIKMNIVDNLAVNTPITINLLVRDSLFDIELFNVPQLVTNPETGELDIELKPLSLGALLLILFILGILGGGLWLVLRNR